MNRISTRADAWQKQCEKWAVAGEPFQVIDVDKPNQDVFFMFICSVYKFALRMDGETTVVFEPRSIGKV